MFVGTQGRKAGVVKRISNVCNNIQFTELCLSRPLFLSLCVLRVSLSYQLLFVLTRIHCLSLLHTHSFFLCVCNESAVVCFDSYPLSLCV